MRLERRLGGERMSLLNHVRVYHTYLWKFFILLAWWINPNLFFLVVIIIRNKREAVKRGQWWFEGGWRVFITNLKKGGSSNQLFLRPKIWSQVTDRRHLGETTLRATAFHLPSEDCDSKTYKPLAENPYCFPSHLCFIDTSSNWGLTAKWSQDSWDGRRKFLGFKNETIKARSSLFLRSVVSSIGWSRRF